MRSRVPRNIFFPKTISKERLASKNKQDVFAGVSSPLYIN
jgi:hypothetical protein